MYCTYCTLKPIQHSVFNVKVLADFNREEVLVGAFPVIVNKQHISIIYIM